MVSIRLRRVSLLRSVVLRAVRARMPLWVRLRRMWVLNRDYGIRFRRWWRVMVRHVLIYGFVLLLL